MATVALHSLTKHYKDASTPAVDSLDLDVADGEFIVLVGPSGCGKTTSLRMLAGLEGVDAGSIHIDDRDVTRSAPSRRDVAMVFQNYVLYPHLTARENIGFHLMIAKAAACEIARRVQEAAELLDLTDVLDRRPATDLGWAASASRHGARDRPPAFGATDGRAVVEPGRQAPSRDTGPHCRAAAASGDHDRLRHP